jgi:hypothetical protein
MEIYSPASSLGDDLLSPEILSYEIMNLHSFADEVIDFDMGKKPVCIGKREELLEIKSDQANSVEDLDNRDVEIKLTA